MFTLLKILFALAIVVPLVIVAALFGGVLLAIVVGIAGAIIGIAFFLVKVGLFLVLPIVAIVWLASRLFGHRRYSHRSGIDADEWV